MTALNLSATLAALMLAAIFLAMLIYCAADFVAGIRASRANARRAAEYAARKASPEYVELREAGAAAWRAVRAGEAGAMDTYKAARRDLEAFLRA